MYFSFVAQNDENELGRFFFMPIKYRILRMKVLKFGGTSVGSVQNMNNVKSIISDGDRKVVVLSAMSGTYKYIGEYS